MEGGVWSPDGTRIAFEALSGYRFEERCAIFTVNPDGTGLRRVSPRDNCTGAPPSWSPDGSRIAVSMQLTDYLRQLPLVTMSRDGTDVRELGFWSNPIWNPVA